MACQQLIEQDSQGINVATRINIQPTQPGLLRTHVGRSAEKLLKGGHQRLLRSSPLDGRLGEAEINDLRPWPVFLLGYQNIRWLDVLVNDPFLMRMLHGLAD